jgi:hypothetical protein
MPFGHVYAREVIRMLRVSTKLGLCSKCCRDVKIVHFEMVESKFSLCDDCWGEFWVACAAMDKGVFTSWELVATPVRVVKR